jgi:hypothetical protein
VQVWRPFNRNSPPPAAKGWKRALLCHQLKFSFLLINALPRCAWEPGSHRDERRDCEETGEDRKETTIAQLLDDATLTARNSAGFIKISPAASFDRILHPGTILTNRFILNSLNGDKQSAPRALR